MVRSKDAETDQGDCEEREREREREMVMMMMKV